MNHDFNYSVGLGVKLPTGQYDYMDTFYNQADNKDEVINNFHTLIEELLKENHPKAWFRAFFNLGLINYILSQLALWKQEIKNEENIIKIYLFL